MTTKEKVVLLALPGEKWVEYRMHEVTFQLLEMVMAVHGRHMDLRKAIAMLPDSLRETIKSTEIDPPQSGAKIKIIYIDEADNESKS